jgi:hypothetical protein
MAYDATLSVAAATWTQITNANATAITFQNLSDDDLWVTVTAGATPPTTLAGALRYRPGAGESNRALADLAPGISGTRVYVYSGSGARVRTSHA